MKELHVSPHAPGDGDGSAERPYDGLPAARRAVRELIAGGLDEDIRVVLRAGTYVLTETLLFAPEDSFGWEDAAPADGRPGRTVTYAAYPGEQAIISSGVTVTEWEPVTGELPGLPHAAKGNVWSARIGRRASGGTCAKTIYDGMRRLPRAPSAPFTPTRSPDPEGAKASELGTSTERFDTIEFPPGAMRSYENISEAELVIRPTHVWVMNILPLKEVNETECLAKTTIPATYPMEKLIWAKEYEARDDTAWVENVFDGLTEPGRWVVDSSRSRVYLWPRRERPAREHGSASAYPAEDVRVPLLTELIRVDGLDAGGGPVRGLAFEGLVFAHSDRITWDENTIGLQHDWDLYDSPNAMVRFRGTEECAIRNCTFTAGGGTAIRLDLTCRRNEIADNTITHMGGTGILLAGYGPGTVDENRENTVVGNHISHCGELYWMSPGIFLWQSGHNRVAHNLLHDLPYNGIVVSGPRYPFFLKKREIREQYGAMRRDETERVAQEAFARARQGEDAVVARETMAYRMTDALERFLHARGNIVEENEIHDVLQVLGDGDAIYFSGTGRGNVIRRNYLHDIVTCGSLSHMIRMDGSQYWTLIEENVVHRCSGGIVTRARCDAINNYVIDVAFPPHSSSFRRTHSWLTVSSGAHGERHPRRHEHNLYYQSDHIDRFVEFNGEPGFWEDVECDRNLYYCPLDTPGLHSRLEDHARETGLDEHSSVADPLFVDAENGDFRLGPDSPAHGLGIKEIDLSRVGLRGSRPERVGRAQ